MDYLFYNLTTPNTCSCETERYDSVLIRDKKILTTGSYHLLNKIATNPEKIDLKGKFLLPAFTDAHTHFVETARQQLTLNVLDCKNEDDFYNKLVDYRKNYGMMLGDFQCTTSSNQDNLNTNNIDKRLSIPKWIKGYGWEKRILDNFPNINKKLIDKVFPDIPVSLASRDLHSNLLNSKALEIISGTNNVVSDKLNGIEIGRFSNGEPNGFLYENSWTILDKYIPEMDNDLLRNLLKKLIKKSYKYGLCGVHSIEDRKSAELVASLCEEQLFYFTWYYLDVFSQANTIQDSLTTTSKKGNISLRDHFITENSHFRNAGIKLFTDGSLGSDSAWMFTHDMEQINHLYKDYLENIIKQIIEAHKQHIQVAIHCIGDYAVYAIANILKEINKKYSTSIKHRIEHLQAVRPEDIKLLKDANVHASMQAIHIKEDTELIKKKWLIAKDYAFPLKSVSEAVEMALGSDAPVETLNPFEGIKYAIEKNINKTEQMSLKEAINAYTYKHHIIANKPITYGILEKDQIANLIIVKKELFDNIWDYDNYETEMTMIDGKVVSGSLF